MNFPRRRFLQLATGATLLPALSRAASAESYPSRAITIVAAGPAGGPTDAIGRVIGTRMQESLGQTVLIENRPSSGGIAVSRVGRAEPDGYTIELGHWGTNVVDGAVLSLPFDLLKDFEPIAQLATNPLLIMSNNAVPAKDLKELIAWLKANPDKATLGSPGVGSPPHVAGIFFQKLTDTRFRFVPYRGGAPAMTDLISGQIDLNFPQAAIALPQARAGAVRAYAVTSKTRLASAPEIPTTGEAGVDLDLSVWHGLWAPKATPKDRIAKLNAAVVEALADPEVRRRLTDLGQDIPPREQQTPEALGAYQKAEIEKWWPIVKAAGIKVE
jgi:tripartite-type tricarboxylate transporter receptor subunit TctC